MGLGLPCPRPIEKAKDWVENRAADAGAIIRHGINPQNPTNIFNQILGASIAALSSCDREQKEGGIVVYRNCGGLSGFISNKLFRGQTFTVGSFILSPGPLEGDLLKHELAHVEQYDVLGGGFLPIYTLLAGMTSAACQGDTVCTHGSHPLEFLADKRAGTDIR